MPFPHPSVDRHRPRLELSRHGTGVVPFFRAPPPPPVPEPTAREALTARIGEARATALAACHPDRDRRPQLMLVGHNELTVINADLETVRALNATLPHHYRHPAFAAWETPVFRPAVLHSWRDMFRALDAASSVLAAAAAYEQTWIYAHG